MKLLSAFAIRALMGKSEEQHGQVNTTERLRVVCRAGMFPPFRPFHIKLNFTHDLI